MITSKVTSRGQTTLPRKVRDALHLREGDRLSYELTDNGVLIKPHQGIAALFGSLPVPDHLKGVDFNTAREQALAEHAAEVAKKGLE